MANAQYHGIERHQEIDATTRRDDTRSWVRRMRERASSGPGTIRIFGPLVLAALALSWFPFLPEAIFLLSIVYLWWFYLGKRSWDMPFRVPEYLGRKGFIDRGTNKPGEGLIYMGAARPGGKDYVEEVWATPSDIRTHRMVIGTTGSGKTEEMLSMVFNSLMLQSGSLLIDGKAGHQTYDSMQRICRMFGRDEDLFLVNYIMGGKDLFGASAQKLSHTYNPFATGSSTMKGELVKSLLPTGENNTWTERAILFVDAIMPVLTFISERGYTLFGPRLLVDYYNLERIENLLWFGILERFDGVVINLIEEAPMDFAKLQVAAGQLKAYVENIPSYDGARPTKPHIVRPSDEKAMRDAIAAGPEAAERWARQYEAGLREAAERADAAAKQAGRGQQQTGEAARQKVYEQHGYITMQLVRPAAMLTFEYSHVFNVEHGEIDFKDLMLNRRLMYTALPSMERAPSSLSALGKLAVSSVKQVLATLMDQPFEGFRREIIEGRPSNSEVPYLILLDEYGFYVTEGFSVVPAQARSFGASVSYGLQELDGIGRVSPQEGAATWGNTNLKVYGRFTSGTDSETFRKYSGAAGEAHISVASDMTHRRGKVGSQFELSSSSRMERQSRLSIDDVGSQQNGEFHLIVGVGVDAGSDNAAKSGIRVIRYLALYTGSVPEVPHFRLNHFVQVKPPSPERIAEIRRSQAMKRALRGIREESVASWLSKPEQKDLKAGLEGGVLDRLIGHLSMLPDDLDDEAIVGEGLALLQRETDARLGQVIYARVAEEVVPLERAIIGHLDRLGLAGEDRAAIGSVLAGLCEDLRSQRVAELTMSRGVAHRVRRGKELVRGFVGSRPPGIAAETHREAIYEGAGS